MIVHVHPTSVASSGKNATFARFMEAVKGKVSTSEIKVPGQKTMKNDMKCGKKQGRVEARTWSPGASTSSEGKLVLGNPADIRFADHELITIAFVPSGAKVPPPPSAGQLNSLSDVTPAATIPAATPETPGTTTVPTTAPATAPSTSTPAAP